MNNLSKQKIIDLLSDFSQEKQLVGGLLNGFHKFRIDSHDYDRWRLIRYLFSYFLDFTIWDKPFEKTNWEIPFTYKKTRASFAHQKFGFRIYIDSKLASDRAEGIFKEILGVIDKAIKSVEPYIRETGADALDRGDIIVKNRLHEIEEAYDFFRDESKKKSQTLPKKLSLRGPKFSYSYKKDTESRFLADAAYISFFSLIEHLCILAFPFSRNKNKEKPADFFRGNWDSKFKQVFPHNLKDFKLLYGYLKNLARYRRNPSAHGYLDKLNTIFRFYLKGARHKIPMNLYDQQLLLQFNIHEVGFDKLDSFLKLVRSHRETKRTMQYLDAQIDIGYDKDSIKDYDFFKSLSDKDSTKHLNYLIRMIDDAANMDW